MLLRPIHPRLSMQPDSHCLWRYLVDGCNCANHGRFRADLSIAYCFIGNILRMRGNLRVMRHDGWSCYDVEVGSNSAYTTCIRSNTITIYCKYLLTTDISFAAQRDLSLRLEFFVLFTDTLDV